MCNLFDFGPKWVMSMKWYIGGRHFYRKTALCTREKDAADTIIHVVWCVIFSLWNIYSALYYDVVQTHGFTAQRGFMWILSFHWIVRHQISCQNQLNLKTDFISPPNAIWLWLWIYSGLLWNVVRAKCGGGSSFDNITCTFLSRKLNFIFWICSMIGYFWDFEIWSRV